MRAANVIDNCLREKNMTQTEVASHLGESIANFNQRLRRDKDIKVSTFVEILEAMGFRVDIVDIGINKVSSGYIEKIVRGDIKVADGKYYCITENADTEVTGVCSKDSKIEVKKFENATNCLEWLTNITV